MGTWTTHYRIDATHYRAADEARRDELVTETERRVRTALRGAAADPDVEITMYWRVVIPGSDPTASEFHVHGDTMSTWAPGEDVPRAAAELVCRGRTVT